MVVLTQFSKVQPQSWSIVGATVEHVKYEYEASTKPYCEEVVWQAGAAGAIAAGHDCWGSFLFCLSLNHKQMSMYYAPACFAHLLGKCLQQPTPLRKVHKLRAANSCYHVMRNTIGSVCSRLSET